MPDLLNANTQRGVVRADGLRSSNMISGTESLLDQPQSPVIKQRLLLVSRELRFSSRDAASVSEWLSQRFVFRELLSNTLTH